MAGIGPGPFAAMALSEYPASCKFMCYRHSKHGRRPAPGIVSAGSGAEAGLREESKAWLA